MRTHAASDDDARVIDGDEATRHAGAAIAAQQHIDTLVTRLDAATRHAAALTATAAEGLRQHADGIGAEGVYLGRRRHVDHAAVAALATSTAHGKFRTGRDACHVGRAAVSATAANTLRKEGVRFVAFGSDQTGGLQNDIAGMPADAALEADGHTEGIGGNRTILVGAGELGGD